MKTSRVLSLVGVLMLINSDAWSSDTARYRLTFDAAWSAQTHPVTFPPSPHFSGLVGGTHNESFTLWRAGELASSGIEAMAETGARGGVIAEVQAAIDRDAAGAVISGSGIGVSPNAVSVEFEASIEYPLVSVVSMIAPSPDWFVGVSGLNLRSDDEWIGSIVHDLPPYDSGTDSGVNYTSANADTDPAEVIASIQGTFPFEDTPPIGTFTFLRLLNGDFDESGTLDAADIDALSNAVRTGDQDSKYDVNSDGVVDDSDRFSWVKDIRNTSFGDADLNGSFDSGDFITVFRIGEYEDGIANNSGWADGDWNGDEEFDSGDLVTAFQDFARFGAEVNVANVPEPASLAMLCSGLGMLSLRRRK